MFFLWRRSPECSVVVYSFHPVFVLCSLIEFPGILHELDEVVIVVNVSADGGVVVVPLLAGQDAITVTVAEGAEELNENFLGGHLAGDHLGVVRGVVDDAEVGRGNGTIAVTVELVKALSNDVLSGVVGLATEAHQELVVGHNTVSVGVEVLKKKLSLAHGDGGTEVLKSPVELLLVDLTVTVVIEDAEGASHSADGANTTRVKAISHLIENCHRIGVQSQRGLRGYFVTYFRKGLLIRPLCLEFCVESAKLNLINR